MRRTGSTSAQSSCAAGHRVRKRHPDGGLTALGSSPLIAIFTLVRSTDGSGSGMAAMSPAV